MKKSMIVLFLVLLASLTACTRQVGWVGMNYGSTFQASYFLFDGPKTQTIRLDAGDTLTLRYELDVDDGALTLQWIGPGKTMVWNETFTEDTEDVYTCLPESGGRCTLRLIGDQTQRGFDLQWEIADGLRCIRLNETGLFSLRTAFFGIKSID